MCKDTFVEYKFKDMWTGSSHMTHVQTAERAGWDNGKQMDRRWEQALRNRYLPPSNVLSLRRKSVFCCSGFKKKCWWNIKRKAAIMKTSANSSDLFTTRLLPLSVKKILMRLISECDCTATWGLECSQQWYLIVLTPVSSASLSLDVLFFENWTTQFKLAKRVWIGSQGGVVRQQIKMSYFKMRV